MKWRRVRLVDKDVLGEDKVATEEERAQDEVENAEGGAFLVRLGILLLLDFRWFKVMIFHLHLLSAFNVTCWILVYNRFIMEHHCLW